MFGIVSRRLEARDAIYILEDRQKMREAKPYKSLIARVYGTMPNRRRYWRENYLRKCLVSSSITTNAVTLPPKK